MGHLALVFIMVSASARDLWLYVWQNHWQNRCDSYQICYVLYIHAHIHTYIHTYETRQVRRTLQGQLSETSRNRPPFRETRVGWGNTIIRMSKVLLLSTKGIKRVKKARVGFFKVGPCGPCEMWTVMSPWRMIINRFANAHQAHVDRIPPVCSSQICGCDF